MATITHERLAAAMRQALADLVAGGRYGSAMDVNRGYCGDFSDDVYVLLGNVRGLEPHADLSQLDVAMLMTPEEDGGERVRMDRDLLAEHWPGIVPPEGMDWDDVDQMAGDVGFDPGLHVWTVLDGRHYDAEAPDGVDNLFDLPFFERLVMAWQAERAPRMAP